MTKAWEYKVEIIEDLKADFQEEALLTHIIADKWELVTVTENFWHEPNEEKVRYRKCFYFRRPEGTSDWF